jgi:cytochrome b pre-mRNA-processing protein 3
MKGLRAVKLFKNLLGRGDERDGVRPLYNAIIAEARQTRWYDPGGVADTIDGRFEMVTVILALVLIRMEALGVAAQRPSTLVTEVFVQDMDGQLRELGIGDIIVGKHIGKMMSALGGRLGAYRAAFGADAPVGAALVRNLYRGEEPSATSLAATEQGLISLRAQLAGATLADLLGGRLAAA